MVSRQILFKKQDCALRTYVHTTAPDIVVCSDGVTFFSFFITLVLGRREVCFLFLVSDGESLPVTL